MPRTVKPWNKQAKAPAFSTLFQPVHTVLPSMPPLEARGNRPLHMEFEHQLKALILYHLEEYTSGTELLQVLEEDSFARDEIAPATPTSPGPGRSMVPGSGMGYPFTILRTTSFNHPNGCSLLKGQYDAAFIKFESDSPLVALICTLATADTLIGIDA